MKRVVVEGGTHGEQKAFCDHPSCSNFVKAHAWGWIKAGGDGWFFQKNGDCWCPDHIPEWVSAWREKRKGNDSI